MAPPAPPATAPTMAPPATAATAPIIHPPAWARPGGPTSDATPATPTDTPTIHPPAWARPGGPSSDAPPATPTDAPTTDPPATPADTPTTWIAPAYGPPQVSYGPPQAGRPYEPPAQPNVPPTDAKQPHGRLRSEALAASVKTRLRSLRSVFSLRSLRALPSLRSLRSLLFARDPLSIVLILCILVALLGTGVIGSEIYARKRAAKIVAAAAECELKDPVKVSIGIGPMPFLLQYVTGNYTDISMHTAGNQVRTAKGMTADITVNDVDLRGKGNSKGTIGAVDANVVWTTGGIKSTLEDQIKFLKEGMLENISANPGAGTIQINGAWGLASVTLKPQVADGGLSLEVTKLTAMGAAIPHEPAQMAMKAVNSKLTKGLPLGMRAESVHVTSEGVTAHFTKHNAQIPANDPCFAHI
jgi:hypothetical protein